MKASLLFSNYPFIKCDRVTLNRISELDLRSLWEIMSDDENYRYNPTGAMKTKDTLRLYYQRMESLFRERKRIFLGIYANERLSKLIGLLEISHLDPQPSKLRINIMINRYYSGRGYARSALRGLERYLFETIEVNRIEAYVMPSNKRCLQLLERSGFFREGTIREGFYWPDKGLVDLDLYAILYSDYQKIVREDKLLGRYIF